MTRRRLLLFGTIVLAAVQCLDWVTGALIARSVCCWLVGMPFTIALAIGAALNVVGFVSFLLRRRTWGWAALARVQIGNILFSLVAAVVVSPVWLLLNTAPSATTLILSVVLRKVEAARAMATR